MSMFCLTEDQAMIQSLARDLAQSKIKQTAAEVDNEVVVPSQSLSHLAQAGLIGCIVPEQYGGAGLDYMSHILAVEEVAKVCASTAALVSAATAGIEVVLALASETQKADILPALLEGKMISIAANEGAAGLNPTNISATAEKKGDGYLLNGAKCYVANAGYSDYYIAVCADAQNGLQAFLVSKENPGLKFGKLSPKMGLRACVAGEIFFENCAVGASALLGCGKKAIEIARASERLSMAAVAVGIAQGAVNEAIRYTNERVQFGKRISQFQNTQTGMADIQSKISAGRMLAWSVAARKDAGEECAADAAMAKLFCADAANIATRKCVQFMGGCGYSREYPVERMMRDAKMTEIYAETAEEQRAAIALSMGVC